jgi:hypothetical protein
MQAPLLQGRLPTRHIPSVIAGLNRPLVTLKKTHALTTSEKPRLKAAYSKAEGGIDVRAGMLVTVFVKATWQPARAKNRKKVVPMNSADVATSVL